MPPSLCGHRAPMSQRSATAIAVALLAVGITASVLRRSGTIPAGLGMFVAVGGLVLIGLLASSTGPAPAADAERPPVNLAVTALSILPLLVVVPVDAATLSTPVAVAVNLGVAAIILVGVRWWQSRQTQGPPR